MKNNYYFASPIKVIIYITALISFSAMRAQDVVISDPAFKSKLIALGVDSNGDGEIQFVEAEETLGLDLSNSNINFLGGLEAFTNIGSLNINGNNIEFLDISPFSQISDLSCSNNPLQTVIIGGSPTLFQFQMNNTPLQELDFSGCTSLQGIFCANTSLVTLNLSGCTGLVQMQVVNSLMASINLSGLSLLGTVNLQGGGLMEITFGGNTALSNLNLDDNMLFTLDLTEAPNLHTLTCQNNNISPLVLTNNSALVWLACANNWLTTLDVSNSPLLEVLHVANNSLQSLFMKNGADEDNVVLSGNPSLSFICADESQIVAVQAIAGPSVVVNSYCTFTPGGDYNTIAGTIRFDGDNNGCDASDATQSLIKVRLNSAQGNAVTFTNAAGNYNFYTGAGDFMISPEPEVVSYFNLFLPVAVNFPIVDGSVATQNFCISANGVHSDAEVVMAPVNAAQPGFSATYLMVFRNKGNQVLTGSVHLNFNDTKLDFVSASVPGTQSGGSLTFNYANLLPFESRSVLVTFEVNSPTDNPPVNIGDVLNFTAFISHGGVEETGTDNEFHYSETVTGAFDPNNVLCIEGQTASTEAIGDYLHYIVNFENTGNAAAQNIVVHQNINPADFDIESLQVLNSSHPVTIRIHNGICEFIFNGINLGSGGHGNILMKIRSVPTLNTGDSVASQADIYFDYNFPVATNLATTTFTTLSINDPVADASLRAYPNPTGGIVTISANDDIRRLQLYDVQGRLLQTSLEHQKVINLDVSDRPGGIYFIKVTTAAGTTTIKMIRS